MRTSDKVTTEAFLYSVLPQHGEGVHMKRQRSEDNTGWIFETCLAVTLSSSFLFRGHLTLQVLMKARIVHQCINDIGEDLEQSDLFWL